MVAVALGLLLNAIGSVTLPLPLWVRAEPALALLLVGIPLALTYGWCGTTFELK
jgi:hypothetical protein